MPHVSKKKTNTKLFEDLFQQLVDLPVGLSREKTNNFFSSLLTKTEQEMLAKRCAAAVMFAEGYSNYRVWSVLQISPSTATRLREQYDDGVYDGIVSVVHNRHVHKKQHEDFVETFNKIMRLGMPSMGKDRWEYLKKR